jgi:hypothetical protein
MKHKNAQILINNLLKVVDEVDILDTVVDKKVIYTDNEELYNHLFYLLDMFDIDFDAYTPDEEHGLYRIDFTDSKGFAY